MELRNPFCIHMATLGFLLSEQVYPKKVYKLNTKKFWLYLNSENRFYSIAIPLARQEICTNRQVSGLFGSPAAYASWSIRCRKHFPTHFTFLCSLSQSARRFTSRDTRSEPDARDAPKQMLLFGLLRHQSIAMAPGDWINPSMPKYTFFENISSKVLQCFQLLRP